MHLYAYGYLNHSLGWVFSDQNKHHVLRGRLEEKYQKMFFKHPASCLLHCWMYFELDLAFM